MTVGIQEKIVAVTGASSGLGEVTARFLSEQGATVVLGDRRLDRLQSLTKELEKLSAPPSAPRLSRRIAMKRGVG